MAGFGLPNFGQLTEAFKKAKQIQQDAQKLQDELENMEIEGKSDDEMIKVWISGNQLPLKVEVQKNILNTDKEKIEKNILQAMQKAHELSTTTMKERMNDLTGGLNLNLPGFDNSDSYKTQSFLYKKNIFRRIYLNYSPHRLNVSSYEIYT